MEEQRCLIEVPPDGNYIEILGYRIDGFDSFESFGEYLKKFDSMERELQEYRDLEEQGLLLRLPCKTGDTVYQITRNFISEYEIMSFIKYNNGNIFFNWKCTKGIYIRVDGFRIDDIGKTVFLTREEAEEALKKVGSENE